MRILMFGAGVIGHIYGSQLAEAGHHVALHVRPGAENHYPHGMSIRLLDLRKHPHDLLDFTRYTHDYSTNYRPEYVSTLSPKDAWDLIVVCTTRTQLPSVLPVLAGGAGKADILFFQNNWSGTMEIAPYLPPERYLFGFPMGGGAFDALGIEGVIKGPVLLGEADAVHRPRLDTIAHVFKDAGFTPQITEEILPFLWTHYAINAALVGGAARAHGFNAIAGKPEVLKDTMQAAREALQVVRARGVDTSHFDEALPFDLPSWVGVPAFKLVMQGGAARRMADKHGLHAREELVEMFWEVLRAGRNLGVSMPTYATFEPDVAAMENEESLFGKAPWVDSATETVARAV